MRSNYALVLAVLAIGTLSACGGAADQNHDPLSGCRAGTADELSDDITADMTLSRCTLVTEKISLFESATLTVPPGAAVLFERNTGFTARHDSSINAVGTENAPIVFTGTNQIPGFWRGIYYEGAGGEDNILDHVTIEYAGGDDWPSALEVHQNTIISVRNSAIRQSATAGFNLAGDTNGEPEVQAFENNTITENALAGISSPMSADAIDPSNDLRGNTEDRLKIRSVGAHANVTESTTYHNIGVPYVISDAVKVFSDATWTVEAGVEILMGANTSIDVDHDGVLSLEGTAAAPIVIRGQESAPGYWEHIELTNTSSPSNRIAHTTIADAGAGGAESASAIQLEAGRDTTTRLALDQVTIRDSGAHGFFGEANTSGSLEASGCDTVTFDGIGGDEFAGEPMCG